MLVCVCMRRVMCVSVCIRAEMMEREEKDEFTKNMKQKRQGEHEKKGR